MFISSSSLQPHFSKEDEELDSQEILSSKIDASNVEDLSNDDKNSSVFRKYYLSVFNNPLLIQSKMKK